MAVRIEKRRGKRILVIDITYRDSTGRWARFRRDSKAPNKAAAQAEERRIQERIATTGSPYEIAKAAAPSQTEHTYAAVVREYRETKLTADLKATTGKGYRQVLDQYLLPRFGDWPVSTITGVEATKLDHELALRPGPKKNKRGRSVRNNVQIVLRSTLRFAVERGHLAAMPTGMPKLKQPGKVVLTIPTDDEVQRILGAANARQRRVFALMAFAGLRPNEVRALEWQNASLNAPSKMLQVLHGQSLGKTDTPKTGPRVIPIAPALFAELLVTPPAKRKGFVARSKLGKPWGQSGMNHAFKKIAKQLGMPKTWTLYYLRHYAITSWLRRGIPVHVVQKMAGHNNLATTEKYAHALHADLEQAARLLGNILETEPEAAE